MEWSSINVEESSDHGRSWIRGIPDSGGSINRLVRDAAYDHSGILWVLWTTYDFSDLSTQCTLHLAKSHDQGRSFTQVFATLEENGLFFKSKLAVDPSNNLYVLWDRKGATLTRLRGGDSLHRLDTVIPRDSLLVGLNVGLAVGPDYTVYCLWTGVRYLPDRRVEVAYCTRSIDSGKTFQAKVALDSASANLSNSWVTQMEPTATLDHSGALYAAYTRALYVNQYDIHLSVTTDRGATFRVIGAATDDTAENRYSTLCIGADGSLHLVYDGGDRFLRYVTSKDSGLHFSSPLKLFTGTYPIVKAVAGGPVSLVYEDSAHIMFSSLQGSDEVAEIPKTPIDFRLEQNYPNPFNPSTNILYTLPHRAHVTLTVYNTLGQKVAELVNNDIDPGNHEVKFDGSRLASGVYFYRIQAGSFVETKKLLLEK